MCTRQSHRATRTQLSAKWPQKCGPFSKSLLTWSVWSKLEPGLICNTCTNSAQVEMQPLFILVNWNWVMFENHWGLTASVGVINVAAVFSSISLAVTDGEIFTVFQFNDLIKARQRSHCLHQWSKASWEILNYCFYILSLRSITIYIFI